LPEPPERRPRLLDLFCGGGGAAMGYHRAGFDVVGVDWVEQHDYPFRFVRGDATTFPLDGFDAVHASPPCKLWTPARGDRHALRLFDPHADFLSPTLDRLAPLGVPWVVENVPAAPMPAGSVTYCGSSFGLDVRRHRLFASNVELVAPPCDHASQTPGRFPSLDNARRLAGARRAAVVGVHGARQYHGHDVDAARAMGVDWLPWDRLTQAIPPAYTEHIGRQLRARL
jgi:DNA (cytosine-5)-methyltransferase 1